MGQRLNISICEGSEQLASCYYHWSGYTESAFELVSQIVRRFEELTENVVHDKKLAVMLLEGTGASMTEDARNLFKSLYPDAPFSDKEADRNDGLIEIDCQGMDDCAFNAEQSVCIDLKEHKIAFYAWDVVEWDDLRYMVSDDGQCSDDDIDKFISELPHVEEEIEDIPFSGLDKLAEVIKNCNGCFSYNGEVYREIE